MDLDAQFQEAFEKISKLKKAVAPDVMLKFYAYYKQANFGNNLSPENVSDLRNGFKFNAWMQLKGMSPEDAKKEYIALTHKILAETNIKK